MNTRDCYRIVVGVDGSPAGSRALQWAVREAAAHGGAVTAVTAWNWDGIDPTVIPDADAEQGRAEELLGEAISEARAAEPCVPVAGVATAGRPGPVLIEHSRDASLLVLGSHGHGRLFHAVLGSVAEECVRGAGCPVVVLPAPRRERPAPVSSTAVRRPGSVL